MSKLQELIQELCPEGVEFKKLGEISSFRRGSFPQPYGNKEWYGGEGAMPFIQVADIEDNMQLAKKTKRLISRLAQPMSVFAPKGSIIISLQGSIGRIAVTQYDAYIDRTVAIFTNISKNVVHKYFVYQLQSIFKIKEKTARGSTIKTITKEEFTNFEIPLPPLEVQNEIVRILDAFTSHVAELQARKEQYEYYRNKLLTFDENDEGVKWMTLGEIGNICMCKRIMKHQTSDIGEVPFFKIGTFGKEADAFISYDLYDEYKNKYSFPQKGEILISASGTIGRTVIYDGQDAYFQDSNIVWIQNDESKVLNKYLYYYYQIIEWNVEGGTIKRLYNTNLSKTFIAYPSLSEQQRIVSILDKFESLVNDLSEGLPAEIAAVQEQYEYYRNKLFTFKRKS